MSEIDTTECWTLLEQESFGRLAVSTAAGPDIFPINYAVHGRELFFRTAPGSKLVDLSLHALVAFEVDGRHAGMHWSVVVRGEANRLTVDSEIELSGALSIRTITHAEKRNFVRIRPSLVTGRRFALLDALADPH